MKNLSLILNVVLLVAVVILYVLHFSSPGKVESNKTETTVLDLIILVVFFSISFILLSKPFKTKYNPTKRTWYTIIITVALLLGDKMFF